MKFNALVPEFYIQDFKKSLHFYTEILDFRLESQSDKPKLAFITYHDCQIMLQQANGNEDGKLKYPFGRGINLQIKTPDANKILERIKANKYPLKAELKDNWYPIKQTTYGFREFIVMDPDGYLLRFAQPIGFT